ncbi:MAG: phosphoglycerate mutase [Isosphaeraceae bacterium]|jgi:broad specificity phosphatase PhoE|nr:MAG: phosphoglycerate mutase [Isosphaeraceae bacterium]
MSLRLALIRPGATSYDEQNRVQGILDVPLSPRGREECSRLAADLADIDFDALYCGVGTSVEETAEILGRALALRPRKLEELHNLDQGLWQGLQYEEIRKRNLRLFRQWLEDPRTICPPQGETVEQAHQRIRDALRPLLRRHRNQTIALVIPEPLAQIAAALLRGSAELRLDDQPRTACVEWFDDPHPPGWNGKS